MTKWIRTDEAEEAVGTLEYVAGFVTEAGRAPLVWRWVIISLHIAMQGFMVIALRDSAGLIPLKEDCAAAWLEAHQNGKPYPDCRLDSFRNLYRKIKRQEVATSLGATRFTPTGSQGRSIKLLSTLRNQFIHFVPSSWSIESAGLPQMCRDVLDTIEFLAQGYRSILWHDSTHPDRIQSALEASRAALTSCSPRAV